MSQSWILNTQDTPTPLTGSVSVWTFHYLNFLPGTITAESEILIPSTHCAELNSPEMNSIELSCAMLSWAELSWTLLKWTELKWTGQNDSNWMSAGGEREDTEGTGPQSGQDKETDNFLPSNPRQCCSSHQSVHCATPHLLKPLSAQLQVNPKSRPLQISLIYSRGRRRIQLNTRAVIIKT